MNPEILIGAAVAAADARLYAAIALVLGGAALYLVLQRPRVIVRYEPLPELPVIPAAPAPAAEPAAGGAA